MSEQHLHQIIEQIPKQKPDLHRRKVLVNHHQYHHSLQVKQHLEVKINQQMVILNQSMNQKGNKVGHQHLKDHLLLTQIIRQNRNQNPTMTPKRMRIEPEHIGEQPKGDI